MDILGNEKNEQAEAQWQECMDNELAKKRGYKDKAEMEYYINPDNQMVWIKLSSVDVSGKIEHKGKFSYVSWAWAWTFVKTYYPNVNFRYIDNRDGLNYHHDGRYAWVKVGVTINDIEHIEQLPVLNHTNRPIKLNEITSFDVNTALKRCLVKAIALHGLGVSLYAGEDLPLDVVEDQKNEKKKTIDKIVKDNSVRDTNGKVTDGQLNTLRKNAHLMSQEQIKKATEGTLTKQEASEIISSFPWAKK